MRSIFFVDRIQLQELKDWTDFSRKHFRPVKKLRGLKGVHQTSLWKLLPGTHMPICKDSVICAMCGVTGMHFYTMHRTGLGQMNGRKPTHELVSEHTIRGSNLIQPDSGSLFVHKCSNTCVAKSIVSKPAWVNDWREIRWEVFNSASTDCTGHQSIWIFDQPVRTCVSENEKSLAEEGLRLFVQVPPQWWPRSRQDFPYAQVCWRQLPRKLRFNNWSGLRMP